ncbi:MULTISPECIES: hypothetical protein [unclassified Streptomyces]|uniref:hypothetical protein n=1 Tax=unclassified Streptomyces TaxID=2593676 RepID=UPI00225C25FD|nr:MULTISPECIES: hypothetical protein [unclassified Streptomyces]MCX4406109.1 hypothetical protein [Streptomyces sp. NBC_01764]
MKDLECSPNAEVVKRQLASRVRSGRGKSCFVAELEEVTSTTVRQSSEEKKWPDATDDACLVVWRTRKWEIPTVHPDEVWLFSGNVDRPRIIPAELPEKKPIPTSGMRVSEKDF